jgi:hypothetical protein
MSHTLKKGKVDMKYNDSEGYYCLMDCETGDVWYSKSKERLEKKATKLGLTDYIIFEEGRS